MKEKPFREWFIAFLNQMKPRVYKIRESSIFLTYIVGLNFKEPFSSRPLLKSTI
jgi:hypothetical protein